jgi:hypothetical protein
MYVVWRGLPTNHQSTNVRPIERCQFLMRRSLRQQYKLSLRRQFPEASQQFQDKNLCTAIFSARKNGREINSNGA